MFTLKSFVLLILIFVNVFPIIYWSMQSFFVCFCSLFSKGSYNLNTLFFHVFQLYPFLQLKIYSSTTFSKVLEVWLSFCLFVCFPNNFIYSRPLFFHHFSIHVISSILIHLVPSPSKYFLLLLQRGAFMPMWADLCGELHTNSKVYSTT